jgi:hypothetical protein
MQAANLASALVASACWAGVRAGGPPLGRSRAWRVAWATCLVQFGDDDWALPGLEALADDGE